MLKYIYNNYINMLKLVVLSVLCVGLSSAQSTQARCREDIPVQDNFNIQAFSGEWRLIETTPNVRQSGTCNRVTYSPTATNNVISVENGHILNRELLIVTGTATVSLPNGKMKITIGSRELDFWVLKTDYTNYALAYSCIENTNNNQLEIHSWKLSRQGQLSATAISEINQVITATPELSTLRYDPTSQSDADCFYYPAIAAGAPVVLPGSCESFPVQGQANFDTTQFQGEWVLIQSYFSERQSGTCNRQRFNLTNTGVYDVENSHVVDQRRLTVSGTATVVRDGQLTVQIGTGEMPYYILETDYSNYAVAYSCEKADVEGTSIPHQRVFSWILSRTNQLNNEHQTRVNAVIERVDTLRNEYFVSAKQTYSDCLYWPDELTVGEPVDLPGSCDEEIRGFSDFNVTAYEGTWYQMERYPQPWERGTCTGARYTAQDGYIDVLNWQQDGDTLDTIEGTARVNSTDGTAKLIVTLPVRRPGAAEGETSESPLYVLTTDYNDYSLAYSCSNLADNTHRISAWKLSRTRTLSNQGNTAINNYIATRNELNNAYFVRVEHNDDCQTPSSAALVKSSVTVLSILCLALVKFF